MTKDEIIELANKIEKQRDKAKHHHPYNVFTAWEMSENDHTKLLLALLRYQGANGRHPLLTSFLNRFAKGRGKMIHYQNPTDVLIRFNSRYEKDSFMDGLVTFTANGKSIAVIIENKIYDAPDRDDQIRRYISHVTKDKKHPICIDNVWVFYLTGDGVKEVGENSYSPDHEKEETNIGRRFVAINYVNDIINWLKEDVLEARTYPEALTSVVRAYVESLEKDLYCENDMNGWKKEMLCNALLNHHNLKKLSENDINTLYGFRDDVQNIRNDKTEDEAQNIDAFDKMYGLIKSVIFDVEKMAFDAFEKCSTDILNNQWNGELEKLGVRWMAKHRGIGGKNGFVQMSLTEEWDTAHLEWISINVESLLLKHEYKLELHVEGRGNKDLVKQWRTALFKGKTIQLSQNCIMGKTSRTVLVYKVQSTKPIAKMSNKELVAFLKKVYTEDLDPFCKVLIEDFNNYNR